MIPENNARPEDILAFDVTITAAQSNFRCGEVVWFQMLKKVNVNYMPKDVLK